MILRPLGIAKSNMGGWVQSNDMAFINPDISFISFFFFYHKTVLNKHQDRQYAVPLRWDPLKELNIFHIEVKSV